MNKVILIGNIGNNPQLRTLEDGARVINLSLATNERYTNKEGEKIEKTEWHLIEFWNSFADNIVQYAKKGDRIFVEGRLNTQKWTDAEGIERTTTKIRAYLVEFTGFRREKDQFDETPKPKRKDKQEKQASEPQKVVFTEDDPIF